jgi:hypothetical protein
MTALLGFARDNSPDRGGAQEDLVNDGMTSALSLCIKRLPA